MELHSTKQIKQPMVQRNFVVTLRPRLWLVSLPIKSIPARLRPPVNARCYFLFLSQPEMTPYSPP